MANETVKNSGAMVGLAPGTRIGKYEVKERLAIGGQAIIYKCYDSLLDRLVAIKQVSSHLAEDPKFLERFRKEAQILARLGARQPAIVSIYELIEDERGLFIVMEHVEGVTLERTLSDNPGPVEAKATLQILWRLAGALHDVHQAGIIHRDIKPGNIIVGDGLRPKITDFGVAASLTGQTSMLLGTTRYMAPELLSGQHFDGRADMYSLGFIAYEMLVGRAKFSEIFAEVLRDKHSEALRWMKWHSNPSVQAPALHEVNPSVPKPLAEIVAKMMSKDPAGRFDNMEALGRAIKLCFSPRAKASAPKESAENGEARGQRPRRHRPPSEVVAAAHALSPDEGDELEIGGGPATAPIPKKQLSKRAKIALASAAGAVLLTAGIVFWIYSSVQATALAALRSQAYDSALQNMESKGDYALAMKQFKYVLEKYPGSDEATKATVMIPLTEGHLAIQEKDWKLAAVKEDAATTANDKINGNKKSSASLVAWTRVTRDDLGKFSKYRTSMQEFHVTLDDANKAIEAGQFEKARGVVNETLAKQGLPDDKRKELDSLLKKINVLEFRALFAALLKKGQEDLGKGNYAETGKAYDEAGKMLEADEAGAKVLSKEDLTALKEELAKAKANLAVSGEYAKWMAEADAAEAIKDYKAAKTALEGAFKIKPSPELTQRLNHVQSRLALAEGQALEVQKKYPEARKAYVDSLRFEENQEARAGLDRVAKIEAKAVKIAEANRLYDASNFIEAMKAYEEIIKGGTDLDDASKDRLRECKYKVLMDEGDALRDKKEFDKALQKYEQARSIKPENGVAIDERERQLKTDQEYDGLVADGKKALGAGNWGPAIDQFTKAQKKKDTDEARELLKRAKFNQRMSLGNDAMGNDPASAESYYKLALPYAQTDDERKKAEEAIKQAQDKRKEGSK